ncbi:hypothetical protein N8I77_008773 [Diaporthe amygdali]|uniref:Alpha/beta hydrolase fold-3 domain-containing protein n=1 Tax=Phomopsis amygdali TaxID=1214568 RepID=A0AAD9W029_PHOAM|nr:hypothetical protein N8I77_008773 [Diaporthe amygdali]
MWIAVKPFRRDKSLAQSKYSMRRKCLLIPSQDPGRRIKADLYLPPQPSSGNMDHFRPVLVNYHGSGFVLAGLLGSNVLYCARIACELGIAVLDADYRKAPDHPFPAAIHDVKDVPRWVLGPAAENTAYLFDRRLVMLSGFSSGFSLALAAASVLRTDTYPSIDADIRAVVRIYPSTDLVTPPGDKGHRRRVLGSHLRNFRGYVSIAICRTRSNERILWHLQDARNQKYTPKTWRYSYAKAIRWLKRELHWRKDYKMTQGAEQGSIAWKRREEMYAMAVETIGHAAQERLHE